MKGAAFPLWLAEVEALGGGRAGHRAPFLLVFTAPAGLRAAQATYRLAHGALGVFELFLVPCAPAADGLPRLVATFN